jgi:hypothetical protein
MPSAVRAAALNSFGFAALTALDAALGRVHKLGPSLPDGARTRFWSSLTSCARTGVFDDDVDQLPLVGPGQVLADIIASGAVLSRAPNRGLPPGRPKPDRCQCPPHKSGPDARLRRRRR